MDVGKPSLIRKVRLARHPIGVSNFCAASLVSTRRSWRVILVKSALDVYTGPVSPNSLWHDEWAVREKLRIHYADLDPAVGSTRLFAAARNTWI